jgi:subtilisin family serine protease
MTHIRSEATARRVAALFVVATLLQATVGGAIAMSDEASPKDAEFYKLQWNMKAIRAHAAFSLGAEATADAGDGDRQVLVAVVDTGIDYEHPDLGIAKNADGSPGNGGRVDLELSTSKLTRVAACPAGEPGTPYAPTRDFEGNLLDESVANPRGKHRVMDFHSHGTAIAGLVASNAQYLAGLTQRTTLFGVKVHGMSRINCLGVYLEGITYAADMGADVIHLSIPLEFNTDLWPGQKERVNAVLDYAHAKGAVLVAAAGNVPTGGIDLDADPAQFRFCEGNHVICVSATGPTSADQVEEPYWDQIAAYSNFGSDIDVAGPGGTTTVPVTLTCSTNTRFGGAPQANCRPPIRGFTWTSTGTSFGAGATSGLAALLFRVARTNNPDVIGQIIEQTADNLVVAGEDVITGEDDLSGFGRINVKDAVDVARALP